MSISLIAKIVFVFNIVLAVATPVYATHEVDMFSFYEVSDSALIYRAAENNGNLLTQAGQIKNYKKVGRWKIEQDGVVETRVYGGGIRSQHDFDDHYTLQQVVQQDNVLLKGGFGYLKNDCYEGGVEYGLRQDFWSITFRGTTYHIKYDAGVVTSGYYVVKADTIRLNEQIRFPELRKNAFELIPDIQKKIQKNSDLGLKSGYYQTKVIGKLNVNGDVAHLSVFGAKSELLEAEILDVLRRKAHFQPAKYLHQPTEVLFMFDLDFLIK